MLEFPEISKEIESRIEAIQAAHERVPSLSSLPVVVPPSAEGEVDVKSLMKQVKKQQKLIDKQEEELAEQKKLIAALVKRIDTLEERAHKYT